MPMIRTRPREAVPSFFTSNDTSATPFTPEHLALAPAATGVYFLYRGERLVYIGVAVHGTGIRHELHNHLRGSYGPPTQNVTAYGYELTRDPIVVKHEYLEMHKASFGGRLPAYNTAEG